MPVLRFLKSGCGLVPAFQAISKALEPLTTKVARSGESTLKKIGAPELAQDILSSRTQGEIKAGGLVADYTNNIKGLSKPEFSNMIEVIQGTGRAMNARVATAARAESARMTQVERALQSAGLDTSIDPVTSTRTDKALLPDYYTQAGKKLGEFSAFGPRQGKLPRDVRVELDLIKRNQGTEAVGYAYQVVDAYFNPDRLTQAEQVIWDKLSKFEVATKLGTSVISNATQPANIALVTGNTTMLQALGREISDWKGSKEFSLRAGSILSSITHESGMIPEGIAGKIMLPHSKVELHNRIMSSMAGAIHAQKMFQMLKNDPTSAYARRHLSHWLGLDPDVLLNQRALTQNDVLTAAHTLTDRTQFRTTAMETPPSWGSGLIPKMVTLFKNFAFNQARFTHQIFRDELLKGNFRVIIPLLTTLPILGFLADRGKKAVAGSDIPESFWRNVFETYTAVGGYGLISDMAARAAYAQLANAALGPIAGDITNLAESFGKGTKEDPLKATKKLVVSQFPVAGRRIGNAAYPPEKKGPGDVGPVSGRPISNRSSSSRSSGGSRRTSNR